MNIDIYFDMFVEYSNTLFVVYSLEYFLVFFFVNFEGSLGSLDIRVLLDKCVVVWIFSHRQSFASLFPIFPNILFSYFPWKKCEHLYLRDKCYHEIAGQLEYRRPGKIMAEGRKKAKGEKAEKGENGTMTKNGMCRFLNIENWPRLIKRQQLVHMPLTFRDVCWLLRLYIAAKWICR